MTEPKFNQQRILSFTIGLVYLWFGVLKFFPNLSPAEDLAINTIAELTFGLIPAKISLVLLALWETAIGLALVLNQTYRLILAFALLHMMLTFSPLVIFPNLSFTRPPVGFTLIGQYIFKNIIIVGALLIIWNENPKQKKGNN